MCVCVCNYICTCMHACMHTYTRIHIYVYTYNCMLMLRETVKRRCGHQPHFKGNPPPLPTQRINHRLLRRHAIPLEIGFVLGVYARGLRFEHLPPFAILSVRHEPRPACVQEACSKVTRLSQKREERAGSLLHICCSKSCWSSAGSSFPRPHMDQKL